MVSKYVAYGDTDRAGARNQLDDDAERVGGATDVLTTRSPPTGDESHALVHAALRIRKNVRVGFFC